MTKMGSCPMGVRTDMSNINILLPLLSSIVSFVLAFLLFRRYAHRRGPHLLLWGIGMVFYGIGGFCEGYYGAFGWNELIFRLWYLVGAILVAAWLGQGTVYLLVKRRWANVLMGILAWPRSTAAFRVFSADLDPGLMTTSLHTGSELSGHAIVTSGVRSLTPIFQPVRHRHAGRRRALLGLDILAEARAAPPHHRQYLHRGRRHAAGIWRQLQPDGRHQRALHQRAIGRDFDVHRLHPGHHADGRVAVGDGEGSHSASSRLCLRRDWHRGAGGLTPAEPFILRPGP